MVYVVHGDIPAKVSGKYERKLHRSVKQEGKIGTLLGNSFWGGKESFSELMENTLKTFVEDKQESLGEILLHSTLAVYFCCFSYQCNFPPYLVFQFKPYMLLF